jgi:hypothetical protein
MYWAARAAHVHFDEGNCMSQLTGEDILAAAARAGWAITPERAKQIATAGAPRIEAFERARARLTFDEDAAGFAAALLATGQPEEPAK